MIVFVLLKLNIKERNVQRLQYVNMRCCCFLSVCTVGWGRWCIRELALSISNLRQRFDVQSACQETTCSYRTVIMYFSFWIKMYGKICHQIGLYFAIGTYSGPHLVTVVAAIFHEKDERYEGN